MRRRKKKSGLKVLIVMLILALIVVAAVIVWKQWEYGASEEFYEGLRGALQHEGAWV